MVLAQTSREDGSHHQGTQLPLSDGSTEKSPLLRHHRRAVSLRKVSPPETPLQGYFTEKSKWGGDTVVCCYLTNGKDGRPASKSLLRTSEHPKAPSSPVSCISCSYTCWLPPASSAPKAFPGGKKRLQVGISPDQQWSSCRSGDPIFCLIRQV